MARVVIDAHAVAGVAPEPPVAVSVNVVVPRAFKVKDIPGELTGFPSSATAVPFSESEMPVAFWVCQLTITFPPCSTDVGVTASLPLAPGNAARAGGAPAVSAITLSASGQQRILIPMYLKTV